MCFFEQSHSRGHFFGEKFIWIKSYWLNRPTGSQFELFRSFSSQFSNESPLEIFTGNILTNGTSPDGTNEGRQCKNHHWWQFWRFWLFTNCYFVGNLDRNNAIIFSKKFETVWNRSSFLKVPCLHGLHPSYSTPPIINMIVMNQ